MITPLGEKFRVACVHTRSEPGTTDDVVRGRCV
jgi:hypothetical protein